MARTPRGPRLLRPGSGGQPLRLFRQRRAPPSAWSTGLLRADDRGWRLHADPGGGARHRAPHPARRGGEKRPIVFVLPGHHRLGAQLHRPMAASGGSGSTCRSSPSAACGRLAIDQPGITAKEPLEPLLWRAVRLSRRAATRCGPGATTGGARSSTTPRELGDRPRTPRWRAPTSRSGSSRTRWAGWSPARAFLDRQALAAVPGPRRAAG